MKSTMLPSVAQLDQLLDICVDVSKARLNVYFEIGDRAYDDEWSNTTRQIEGKCSTLRRDDHICSTHRGHGHWIAKGARLDYMMAELLGRSTGYCRGKGGSMHIADLDIGILGANGIVGGGIPIAVGAAMSIQYKGEDKVSVSFFGDGATNIGPFHEACNLAATWKLPVIFVCENNFFAQTTPGAQHQTIGKVAQRAEAYDMEPAFLQRPRRRDLAEHVFASFKSGNRLFDVVR